jgi:hypothetical protein
LGKTTDFQKVQPQKGSAHPEPIITNSGRTMRLRKKSSNLAVVPEGYRNRNLRIYFDKI